MAGTVSIFGIPIVSVGDKGADARNDARTAQEIADEKAVNKAMLLQASRDPYKYLPMVLFGLGFIVVAYFLINSE